MIDGQSDIFTVVILCVGIIIPRCVIIACVGQSYTVNCRVGQIPICFKDDRSEVAAFRSYSCIFIKQIAVGIIEIFRDFTCYCNDKLISVGIFAVAVDSARKDAVCNFFSIRYRFRKNYRPAGEVVAVEAWSCESSIVTYAVGMFSRAAIALGNIRISQFILLSRIYNMYTRGIAFAHAVC